MLLYTHVSCFKKIMKRQSQNSGQNPPSPKRTRVVRAAASSTQISLYAACENNDVKAVKALLADPRVDVNQADNSRRTPLIIASYGGHVEVVSVLLADPRVDVNQADNPGGVTPLIITSARGHGKVASILLADERVDVNQSSNGGYTPLSIASHQGHSEVVQALLADPRVDVNQPMNKGWTPLMIASRQGHAEVVATLLADPRVDVNQAANDGCTPLRAACNIRNEAVIRELLSSNASFDIALYRDFETLFRENISEEQARSMGEELAVQSGKFERRLVMRVVPVEAEGEEQTLCAICQEVLDGAEPWVIRRCGHAFHTECIGQWGLRSNECPLCRLPGVDFRANKKVFTLQGAFKGLRF